MHKKHQYLPPKLSFIQYQWLKCTTTNLYGLSHKQEKENGGKKEWREQERMESKRNES